MWNFPITFGKKYLIIAQCARLFTAEEKYLMELDITYLQMVYEVLFLW